jgi:hypothetical protein
MVRINFEIMTGAIGYKWLVRSQSRMRGDYLFYEEKIEITQAEKDEKAARRFVNASKPFYISG